MTVVSLRKPHTIINVALALDLMERAVVEKGEDYIVNECVYLDGANEGCCIIGTALSMVVPQQTMVDVFWQGGRNSTIFGAAEVQEALAENGVRVESDAIAVLRRAQIVQDRNRPWGEAIQAARETSHTL